MPKVRAKDPLQSLLDPIARRLTAEIATAVMGFVETRVKEEAQRLVGHAFAGARGRRRRGSAAAAPRVTKIRPCRVPGCSRPSKGPRFDFFCAVHRDLPAAEKDAIKAGQSGDRSAAAATPAVAAPKSRTRPVRAKGAARK